MRAVALKPLIARTVVVALLVLATEVSGGQAGLRSNGTHEPLLFSIGDHDVDAETPAGALLTSELRGEPRAPGSPLRVSFGPEDHARPTNGATNRVQDISVRAGERNSVYYFTPDYLELEPGDIRLTFINEGDRSHTFNLKQRADWRDLFNFPLVYPGDEAVFEFTILEEGAYVFFCMLYKHVDHGQTGVLTVSR